jgi:AraC-like DNA-binding protein
MQQTSPDLLFSNPKSIENDFYISLQHYDLPISFSPCRIEACLVCVCLAGDAEVEVDLLPYHIAPNSIIVVFPGQILACCEKSGDFTMAYFSFSNLLIDEILFRFPTTFIGFLRESPVYHLPEKEKDAMLVEYFTVLHRKFCETSNVCRSEIIFNLLHNFYLDLYSKVIANSAIHSRQRKRKKEVQEEFFRLVKLHTTNREVAFYAAKLCITPKYLSIITKESTGNSAKELIDKFAITELKLQLKTTSTPLKEIAAQLNYPCEAFLCKYFKKHTGLTPSHYRNASR